MEKLKVIGKIEKTNQVGLFNGSCSQAQWKLRTCLDPRNLNNEVTREKFKLQIREEIMIRFASAIVFSTLDASTGFW